MTLLGWVKYVYSHTTAGLVCGMEVFNVWECQVNKYGTKNAYVVTCLLTYICYAVESKWDIMGF